MLGFLQAPSTARRDLLLKLQEAAQAKWEDAKVFEVDAPQEGEWGQMYRLTLVSMAHEVEVQVLYIYAPWEESALRW